MWHPGPKSRIQHADTDDCHAQTVATQHTICKWWWHGSLFHGSQHGLEMFGVYDGLFLTMLAECVSSFVRLTTLILLPECLLWHLWVSVLPRVICLTLRLHLFQALADALSANTTITEFYLNGNPVGDEGVKACWVEREDFGGPSKTSTSNGSIQQFHTCNRDEFGALSK